MKNQVLFVTLALSSLATAQSGPNFSLKPGPSWIILSAFNSVPNNNADISTVFHAKLSNNAPGLWTTALTADDLPSFLGGDGTSIGVVLGEFDPYNGIFLVNAEAAALNSTGDDLHITLSPDGLTAIFERSSGVFLSTRNAVGTAFPAPTAVTGLSSGGEVYPALAPVNGVMKVFYSDGTNIVTKDFDIPTATASGTPTIVTNPAQAGAKPISPTPIIGGDGDAEGLFFADEITPQTGVNTGDSDPSWANDLDPTTPPLTRINRTDYQCCGGLAGGFMYFSHNISPRWHLMHSEAGWIVGDDEAIGGTANVRTAAAYHSAGAGNPLFSTLLFAATDASPLMVPGIAGGLALDLGTLTPVLTLQTTNPDGYVDFAFPIPNNPFLKDKSLAIQALVSNLGTGTHLLTSTGWIHMR